MRASNLGSHRVSFLPMKNRSWSILGGLLVIALILFVFLRDDPSRPNSAAPIESRSSANGPKNTATRSQRSLETKLRPLLDQVDTLGDVELGELVSKIEIHEPASERREMFTELFEATVLRPDVVRLPMALEIARQAEVEPTLRATILADLARILGAERGKAWGDWAVLLEEHLAETSGFIRLDEEDE